MPYFKRTKSQNDAEEEEMKRASSEISVFKDNDEKGDLKKTNFKTSLTLIVNGDPNDTVSRRKESPTRSDYSKLLSSLYAISLILIGFLFPVVEALHDKWLNSEFSTAFSVYLYSVATIYLVYVQAHMLHSNRHGHPDVADDSVPPPPTPSTAGTAATSTETNPVPFPTATTDLNYPQRNASPKRNSHFLSASDSETTHTETSKPRRNLAKHRNLSAIVRYSSSTNLSSKETEREFGASAAESPSRMTALESEQFGEKVEEEFEAWIDMSKLGNIFSHEGSSFYLRLGSLLFGIGHLIYVCLEIENSTRTQPGCPGSTYWWTYIVRLVFIVVQTFFLFKNQTVHIHSQKFLARFGFAHLIATNICIWLRTLVNEIMQEFKHHSEGDHSSAFHASNFTSTVGLHSVITSTTVSFNLGHHLVERAAQETECPHYRGILQYASVYLFPFVLEYSLIAMGTIAIIYASIEDETKDNVVRGLANFFKVQAIDLSDVEKADQPTGTDSDSTHHHGPTFLLKSHRGVFTGILLLAGCAVSITLFFFAMDSEKNKAKAELIYLTSDIILHAILLVASVNATVRIHRLAFIAKPVSIDDILLYVSMAGTLVLEISVAIASGNCVALNNVGEKNKSIEILRMAGSLVASVQTVVQVVLILSGMRRYPSKASHVTDMPGRGLITFLVVGNVSVWVFRTMQAKELTLQGTQSSFYGQLAWLLLMNVSLPLLLFYRFHSSICLADVWVIAYTPLHQKIQGPPDLNKPSQFLQHPSSGQRDVAVADPRISSLIRSISVPQLCRPSSEHKLSHGGRGEEGVDNKIFDLDGISHVSSIPSLYSENRL